jgi:hypothetical protein
MRIKAFIRQFASEPPVGVVIVIIRPVTPLGVATLVLNQPRDMLETSVQLTALARRQAAIGPEVTLRPLDFAHLVLQPPCLVPRELACAKAMLDTLLEPVLALVDTGVAHAMARDRGRRRGQKYDETCTYYRFHDCSSSGRLSAAG